MARCCFQGGRLGRAIAEVAWADAGGMSSSRVFSSSLTSRRFPALRTLTAEDVEVMVMPQQQALASPGKKAPSGAKDNSLFDANLVKPTAVNSLGTRAPAAAPTKRKPAVGAGSSSTRQRPPFRPCNPAEARDTITVERHGYVSMLSPYDLAHRLQMLEREEAEKHVLGGAYNPNAWSKARDDIKVNYFLNSPDAETLEAERRYIKDKAARNMVDYYRRMHANMVKMQAKAAGEGL